VGPWPLDLLSEEPMYDRFLRTLSGYGRVVVYDRPGLGSSDPFDRDRDWLEQMSEACVAVLDAVGTDPAWLVGSALMEYATTIRAHPERVLGAVLINPLSTARFRRIVDSSVERDRSPTMEPQLSRAVDPGFAEWLERANRLGASAADRAEFMSAQAVAVDRFFAEPEPILDGPPTMLIRRRDAMSLDEMEWWVNIFRDAECVTIEGADAGVMSLDAGLIAELAAGFITGTSIKASTDRRLVAVLFTDLVDSIPTAAASGDAVWRATLDRYEANLHTVIQRHHGAVVKHTGDGALATFPSGSEAIAAAVELRHTARDLGLEGRTGIHVGEVEQRGDDIVGIAVHLTARVMGEAAPGNIVVTSTVDETTLGARYQFGDLGTRTLKGIDRPIQLFTVEPRVTP
jgi:class 3 adenylate cyclase